MFFCLMPIWFNLYLTANPRKQFEVATGMPELDPNCIRIAQNLTQRAKMNWKRTLKSPRFVKLCPDSIQSEAISDFLEARRSEVFVDLRYRLTGYKSYKWVCNELCVTWYSLLIYLRKHQSFSSSKRVIDTREMSLVVRKLLQFFISQKLSVECACE